MTSVEQHTQGPWIAVLSDSYGFVYPSVADAIEDLGQDESVEIAVVRGTALPSDRGGTTGALLRRPGSYSLGDTAYMTKCRLVDLLDDTADAHARYEQAKAMAAGLNAAAGNTSTMYVILERGPNGSTPSVYTGDQQEPYGDVADATTVAGKATAQNLSGRYRYTVHAIDVDHVYEVTAGGSRGA